MFPLVLALAIALALPVVVSKPFHPRGPDLAPYGNLTSTSLSARSSSATAATITTTPLVTPPSTTPSSSSPSTQLPPYPLVASGTGILTTDRGGRPRPTDQGTIGPSIPKNDTGPPCTVNIPSGTIDWWFAATFAWPLGTMTQAPHSVGNFTEPWLSNTPNTDTFDLNSILATEAPYTESVYYDTDWGFTWTAFDEYTVTPSATITSVVSRLPTITPPANNLIPAASFLDYLPASDPASLVIQGANGSAAAVTSSTPVLYFSAYEVESVVSGTTATQTFSVPNPYAVPYWVKGIEDLAVATGTVPDEFLQQIPQSLCAAGTVQATVTVVYVVDFNYINIVHANPFIVHIESSVLGLDKPSQTDDVHVQGTGRPTAKPITMDLPIFQPPRIEQTASGLTNKPPNPQQTSSGPNDHHADQSPGQAPSGPEPTSRTVGTIGTNPVVIGPSSVVVVGSQTLTPGAPPITVGDVPVSLVPSGTAVVIGATTSRLPQVLVPPANNNPAPPPVLTIGSTTLTANAATQFFVSPGATLVPGGSAVTVGGTAVSLGPSASFIVVGGSTQVLPTAAPAATQRPEIVVGGSTFTANPGSSFVIGGQTVAPGGPAVTIGGTVVSLGPSASFAVVGGSTQVFPTAAPVGTQRPEIVFGGSTFTAAPGSSFVIGGQTLAPGQAITVDGTRISLAPSASFAVVGGSTQVFPIATGSPQIVVGGSTFAASQGSFIINGQTLAPAGQQITVDGTTLSLGPSASFVVVNGATSVLNPEAQITAPPLTIGDVVFTALPGGGTSYQIGGFTLTPGGAITVGDTTISLAPGATALVINGQTTMLSANAASITNAPLLTIGSSTYIAISGTTFIIGGQTLTPGGVITVDGTTISLAPGATELIYGSASHSTTETLFPATTTRSQTITGTGSASAGASGQPGGAAQTSAKGASTRTKPLETKSLLVSILLGLLSFVLY